MRLLFAPFLCCFIGCDHVAVHRSHDPQFLVPVETLRRELHNSNYEWNGPTSAEDRIPVLHAAQALAYRGDSAAPVLFDAIEDTDIEAICVLDAISELGIPAHLFYDDIMNRDSTSVRKWWSENRESTLAKRNRHRQQIGLPPAEIDK